MSKTTTPAGWRQDRAAAKKLPELADLPLPAPTLCPDCNFPRAWLVGDGPTREYCWYCNRYLCSELQPDYHVATNVAEAFRILTDVIARAEAAVGDCLRDHADLFAGPDDLFVQIGQDLHGIRWPINSWDDIIQPKLAILEDRRSCPPPIVRTKGG